MGWRTDPFAIVRIRDGYGGEEVKYSVEYSRLWSCSSAIM